MNSFFIKCLNDMGLIEKVMLKTYGKNGKTALIQSLNKNTSISSFMTTNDGSCLLNSMEFTDNQLLQIIANSIRNHSKLNGDNCKSLFVYCFTLLNSLTTHRESDDNRHIVDFLRFESIARIHETLLSKWNGHESLLKISTINEFLVYLPSMSVLYDLKNLNQMLSEISSNLAIKLITYYVEKSNSLSEAKEQLLFVSDHLEAIVFYSEKYSLTKSNFYPDGFYIDRRFNLGSLNSFSPSKIKAIFLIRQLNDSNPKSNTFVSIDSHLKENIFKFIHVGNEQQFPVEFVNNLKLNGVNLMLACGYLTEMQKSQLKTIGCSLISYIDVDYVNFICSSYGFKPVYMSECDRVELNQRHLIHVDCIENLDNEQLFYLKLDPSHLQTRLAFIQFCSPVKMFFHQFKIYFHKVVKTLLIVFESSQMVLKCNRFETVTADFCKQLATAAASDCSARERIFFKFLNSLFETLKFKFQKSSFVNQRDYLLSLQVKSQDIDDANEEDDFDFFEPFDLKLKCIMESLNIAHHALKIDSVCHIKKSIKSLNLNSDSD